MLEKHREELKAIVGDGGWLEDDASLVPHVTEWRGIARGRTPLLLKPLDTKAVSQVLAYCDANRLPVVPQGGNTGLCGGAVPDDSNEQVVLNLSRLDRVRSVNADNFSMTVEAGCILARLQQVAEEHDRLFPLSLAAEGSCQIGGNLSTDAGGINVIRYGTAREQVLGLEVVLANGNVLDGLRGLRKDTAGYDLNSLFLGSEGTLGIITAATLKLYPNPGPAVTALVSIRTARDAVRLLSAIRSACGDRIEAFELMSGVAIAFVREHVPVADVPVDIAGDWFVLIELRGAGIDTRLQSALQETIESGLVEDAVIAKNDSEAQSLWRIRHSISEAQKFEGASIKHDIAVPIDRIPELLERGEAVVSEQAPGARLCCFGHVGDGNLHYNVSQPEDADADEFRARGAALTGALYEVVRDLGGTFSAEHGVGVFKKDYLPMFRSSAELSLMRTLKQALDPQNILNPGKVVPTGSDSGREFDDKIKS